MNANELADMLWENYLDNNECEHGFALSSGCHNDDCKEQALYDAAAMLRQQQAQIEALTTQFVRVADENNRLKDQIIMLKKGKVEYGYDTTKTS